MPPQTAQTSTTEVYHCFGVLVPFAFSAWAREDLKVCLFWSAVIFFPFRRIFIFLVAKGNPGQSGSLFRRTIRRQLQSNQQWLGGNHQQLEGIRWRLEGNRHPWGTTFFYPSTEKCPDLYGHTPLPLLFSGMRKMHSSVNASVDKVVQFGWGLGLILKLLQHACLHHT